MTTIVVYGFNFSPINVDAAGIELLKSTPAPEWVQEELNDLLSLAVPGHVTVARPSAVTASYVNRIINAFNPDMDYSTMGRDKFEQMIKHFTLVTPVGAYSCSGSALISSISRYTVDKGHAAELFDDAFAMVKNDKSHVVMTVDNDYAVIEELLPFDMPLHKLESTMDVVSTAFARRLQYVHDGFVVVMPDQRVPLHSKAGFYYINDLCGLLYPAMKCEQEMAALKSCDEMLREISQANRKKR